MHTRHYIIIVIEDFTNNLTGRYTVYNVHNIMNIVLYIYHAVRLFRQYSTPHYTCSTVLSTMQYLYRTILYIYRVCICSVVQNSSVECTYVVLYSTVLYSVLT